jgi:DegV family protein with EDD domain
VETFMSNVAIVTDSTAYLPPELIEKYKIKLVPLQVVWGEDTYRDGVDIRPGEFYDRLETADILPTTSQPSAAEFKTIFEDMIAEGYDVLAILISGGLSGTVASAEQAKKMIEGGRIEIVDSLTTTAELCFHVLEAAQAAAQGDDLAACTALAQSASERSGVIFAVDTLEFLHKGGRIGGAKRFLGTVLNIKPILDLKAGRIDAVEQVRTRRKARTRLLELVQERSAGKPLKYVGVSHARAAKDAQVLLEQAQEILDVDETILVDLSPVIGTHVGPGTLSVAYMLAD